MSSQGQGCTLLGHTLPVFSTWLLLQSSRGSGCLFDSILLLVGGSLSPCPGSFLGYPKIGDSLDGASLVLRMADPHITDALVG